MRSLPPTHQLTKLELEKIPTCLSVQDLEQGFRAALSPFGTVLQLCLYRPVERWFQGYGYAVILNQDGEESTNGLTHRIHYGEINGRDREFYATWKDMGMYCRY